MIYFWYEKGGWWFGEENQKKPSGPFMNWDYLLEAWLKRYLPGKAKLAKFYSIL